ncbi:MAG: hypothetical protein KJ621_17000 [Proteobacteria bacterium]|nr:hypothetical protein [Pseudomonadota bacterium]
METNNQLRLRHCLDTLGEVHDFLADVQVGSNLLAQFKRLRDVMGSLERMPVSSREVEKIESATNRLLGELRVLFHFRDLGDIKPGWKH